MNSIPPSLISPYVDIATSITPVGTIWHSYLLRSQLEAFDKKQPFDSRTVPTNRFKHKTVRQFIDEITKCNFYIYVKEHDYILFYDWGAARLYSNTMKNGFVQLAGDPEEIQKWIDTNSLWEEGQLTAGIDWYYRSGGVITHTSMHTDVIPILETAYPWINGPISDYIDAFNQSAANVLILQGPPGTGKTTLIKNILASCNAEDNKHKAVAMLTYDDTLLQDDSFFCAFLSSPTANYLIIEDADDLLSGRQEGNSLMRKFLNIGDGLMTVTDKKIIFSTNLPSINDIDNALVRPGRCFDVLHFRPLTYNESLGVLCEAGKKKELVSKLNYTLAELVADSDYSPLEHKFGFRV